MSMQNINEKDKILATKYAAIIINSVYDLAKKSPNASTINPLYKTSFVDMVSNRNGVFNESSQKFSKSHEWQQFDNKAYKKSTINNNFGVCRKIHGYIEKIMSGIILNADEKSFIKTNEIQARAMLEDRFKNPELVTEILKTITSLDNGSHKSKERSSPMM